MLLEIKLYILKLLDMVQMVQERETMWIQLTLDLHVFSGDWGRSFRRFINFCFYFCFGWVYSYVRQGGEEADETRGDEGGAGGGGALRPLASARWDRPEGGVAMAVYYTDAEGARPLT